MILNNNSTQQINTLVIQLQNRIANLNNELKSLNKEISNLDTEISDLERKVSSNENDQANDIAAMNAEIKANTKAISGKADKNHTHIKSEITDFPTSLKNPNALTINGKTYDGSTAVDAGVQTVANGGTGVTTQAEINKAFISNLDVGESDVTDGTEFVSSYASDNGFAEGALNKPYKRKFSAVWNYIKDKISSVLGLTASSYSNVQIGGAGVTGSKLTIQGNAVGSNSYTDANPKLEFKNDNGSQNISLTFTDADAVQAPSSITLNGNQGDEYFIAPNIKATGNFYGNLSGKANTAGTADKAERIKPFFYWDYPYVYDATNGMRCFVFKIRMVDCFSSILIQIYSDINYTLSRKYILGLWHIVDYGYNVSVTDLGGTINNALRVWLGKDGNVYLQANCNWVSRISFSYFEDVMNVTVEKIGASYIGSNIDLDGNVLFTPLTGSIIDCGAIRGASDLSSASKVAQYLKADEFTSGVGTFTEKITAPNITSLEQRIAALESKA